MHPLVIRRTPVTRFLSSVKGAGPRTGMAEPGLPIATRLGERADDMNPHGESNLALLFRARSSQYADAVRWRQRQQRAGDESWRIVTFAEQRQLVNQVISGLDALGACPGDALGILSGTRWEWIVADWANMGLGGVTTALYPSLPQETVAFMLRDSAARYLFIEDESQYVKLHDVLGNLPQLRRLIVFDETTSAAATTTTTTTTMRTDPRVLSFAALLALGARSRSSEEADAFAAACAQRIQPDDEAALIYTSGTTGQPKGVIHTHRTLLAQLAGAGALLDTVRAGMVDALFLPLSHVLGRLEHLFTLDRGAESIILPSLDHLAQDIAAAHPHLLLGVPRVYEKAYAAVLEHATANSAAKRAVFRWSVGVGRAVVRFRQERRAALPVGLRLQRAVADALVFRQIRAAFGGRLQFAISGGAPLDPAIIEFFHAIGIPVLEGWGLTETGGAFTVNQLDDCSIGSVGRPYPGHEIRIASDGEVLVRGPCLFPRYHNNPEATVEAIDAQGWFHTGDVGTLDGDGFLRIVDRKKELIVTAGGKKVAPQLVEGLLKENPLVAQACVYGDRHPYLVALLTLDWAAVIRWADQRHIAIASHFDNPRELASVSALREQLEAHVSRVNSRLARFEQVKYFDVLPDDFTVENGLLTPTQKIRRKPITERYRARFVALYHTASATAVVTGARAGDGTESTEERTIATARSSTGVP